MDEKSINLQERSNKVKEVEKVPTITIEGKSRGWQAESITPKKNDYVRMLHEIENSKKELEQDLAKLVSETVAKWQEKHGFAVQNIYVDLVAEQALGAPKKYIVTDVSVDLDYKP